MATIPSGPSPFTTWIVVFVLPLLHFLKVAPALAVADIGIAVGSGTDIAIESSDIILMKPEISDILKALSISRLTIKVVKENLFWAFIYNILAIPVAMGVLYLFGGPLLNPMIAGLAMGFSSVSVVLNALRLKYIKLK